MVVTTVFSHTLEVEIIQGSKADYRLCGKRSEYDSQGAKKSLLILFLVLQETVN